jgi:hypothetical protein
MDIKRNGNLHCAQGPVEWFTGNLRAVSLFEPPELTRTPK